MSNVGLVFDASSFDNFNKSLEKFKRISIDVDTRLEKIASATSQLDDKKLEKFSKSLLSLSKSLEALNKSLINIEMFDNLFTVFQKFSNVSFRIPDFSPFLRTIKELGKLDAAKIKSSMDNLNSVTNIFTGEGFGVALEKAADSTNTGSLSLKNAFNNLKGAFKNLDIGGIFNAINPFAKSLDIFGSSAGGILGKLRMFSNNDVEKLSSFTRSLTSIFDSLKRITKIDIDITKLHANLDAMKIFVSSFSGESAITRIGSLISGIAGSFSSDVSAVKLSDGGIFGKLSTLFGSGSLKSVLNFLQPNGIISQFKNFNTNQVESFRKFANSIRDITLAFNTISEISGTIRNIDEAGLTEFVSSFEFVQNIMRSLISSFTGGSLIDKAFNIFRSITTGNTEGIMRGVASLFGNNGIIAELSRFNIPTLTAFKDFSNSIKDIIGSINDFKSAKVDDAAFETLKNGLEKITRLFVGNKSFIPFFTNGGLINDINSLGKSKLEGFKLFAESIQAVLRAIAKISVNDIDENIFTKIANGIKGSIPLFKSISKDLKGMDLKAIESFSKSLSRILNASLEKTKNDIKIEGIENEFEEQGEESGLSFLSGFKKVLGIHSPSEVMKKMGEFITQGLFEGISNTIKSRLGQFGAFIKNSLVNIFANASTIILKTFGNIFNFLVEKSGIKILISNIKSAFDSIVNKVLVPFGKAFISVIDKIWGFVPKRTLAIVGILGFAISQIPNIIAANAIIAINTTIANLISSLGVPAFIGFLFADTIRKAIIDNFPIIMDAVKFLFEGVVKVWQVVAPILGKAFKIVFDGIGKIIKLGLDIAGKAINFFATSTVNGLRLIENAIRGGLSKSFQFMGNIVKSAANVVKSFFNAISPSNIINGLAALGQKLFYIKQVFDSLYNAAKRFYDLTIGVSVQFESAFTGVLKTLSVPPEILAQGEEAVAAFEQSIRDAINTMATAPDSLLSGLDNAFVTLSQIAENAGALGIAGDRVTEFTEVVGQLTLATDLSADAASNFIAVMSTVTGTQNFQQLGGAITALGNQSAATEAQIAEISQRIIGVGNAAGFTQAQVLGWGAAIRSLGIEAELGGTSFNTLVTSITAATAEGGSKLTQFAELSGMTVSEFTELWNTDASAALQSVIGGLGELDNASRISVLDNLGLDGARMTQFISLISSNTEELNRILNIADESFVAFGDSVEDFNALQEETARRSATTASNLARLGNIVKGVGDIVGQFFLPAFNEILTTVGIVLSDFGNLLVNNKESIQTFFNNILNPVGRLIKSFVSLGSAVFNFIDAFVFGGQLSENIFGNLSEGAEGFSNFINSIASAVDWLSNRLNSLVTFANNFGSAMANIAQKSEFLRGVSRTMGDIVDSLVSVGSLLNINNPFTPDATTTGFLPIEGQQEYNDLLEERADLIDELNKLETESGDIGSENVTYLVQQGDTLSEIAAQYGLTVDELARLNNIEDPNLIITGQTLVIRRGATQIRDEISKIDNALSAMQQNNPLGAILAINPDLSDDIDRINELFDQMRTSIDYIGAGFDQIFGGDISGGIQTVSEGIQGLTNNLGNLFDLIISGGDNPVDLNNLIGFEEGATGTQPADNRNPIIKFFDGLFKAIDDNKIVKLISDNFLEFLSLGIQLAFGLFNPLALGISLLPILADILTSDSNNIGENLQGSEIGTAIFNIIVGLGNAISEAFTLLTQIGSGEDTSETITAVQDNISLAAQGITEAIIIAIQTTFENLPELIKAGTGVASALIGALVGIAIAIVDGIGAAFNELSEEEKMQLAGELVVLLIAAAGLMAAVGGIVGLGSAIIGGIGAGLAAVGVSGAAIIALAIALAAVMIAAITSPEFRTELGTVFEDTIDGIFGEGTYDNFQTSIQNALIEAGLAAGNAVLAFFDNMFAQLFLKIEDLANLIADTLEGAGLIDQANSIRASVADIGTRGDVLTVQADIREGLNPDLATLVDAATRGEAIGLDVDIIVGEIDERVEQLLGDANTQGGTAAVTQEVNFLLDAGVDVSTINANLHDLGFTDEQVQEITDSLIASGDLTVEQVPLLVDGFDVEVDTDNLVEDTRDAIQTRLGDTDITTEEAIQFAMSGEITIDELELVWGNSPDFATALNEAMTAAIEGEDVNAISAITNIADLTKTNVAQGISDGIASVETDPEFLANNALLFDMISGLFDFTPEQLQQIQDAIDKDFNAALSANDTTLASNLQSMGEELINGIVLGMQSRDTLTEEVEATANDVLDHFSELWGIESPSTVMKEMGENLIQGLIEGLNSSVLIISLTIILLNMQLQFFETFANINLMMTTFIDLMIVELERFEERLEEHVAFVIAQYKQLIKEVQILAKETIRAFSAIVSSSYALKINLYNNLVSLKPILDATTEEIYQLADAFYFVVLKAAEAQRVMTNAINQANTTIANGGTNGGTTPASGGGGGGQARKFGGDVFAGQVYELLEGNLPFELFRTATNRTYFLPNIGGQIISPLGGDTTAMFQPEASSRLTNNYGGDTTVINVPVQIDGINGDISDARLNEISETINRNVTNGIKNASNQESLTRRLNRRGKT